MCGQQQTWSTTWYHARIYMTRMKKAIKTKEGPRQANTGTRASWIWRHTKQHSKSLIIQMPWQQAMACHEEFKVTKEKCSIMRIIAECYAAWIKWRPDSSNLRYSISTGYSHLALNISIHFVGNEWFAMLASKCHEIPAFADCRMKVPTIFQHFLGYLLPQTVKHGIIFVLWDKVAT